MVTFKEADEEEVKDLQQEAKNYGRGGSAVESYPEKRKNKKKGETGE